MFHFQVTGRKADAILAAHNCLEAAIRMLRPNQHKNFEVTEAIQKISEAFHCKPVENMVSHELKKNKIGMCSFSFLSLSEIGLGTPGGTVDSWPRP